MKTLFILLFASITVLTCKAQSYDPLTLSRKILSRDTSSNLKKYFTGDFQGHPNGYDLRADLKISFELLNQTNKKAVVAVTLTDSTGKEFDTYLHFERDSIWKVNAFRALAMTGIIEKVYEDVALLTPKQVDSIISSPYKKNKDRRMFKSKDEYNYLLGNTKLTLSSDRELIAHFNNNKDLFEKVKNELIAKGIFKNERGTRDMNGIDDISNQLRMLLIDNVYPNFDETKGVLDFLIGGITDNAVGYFYIANPKNVPEMSPNHFIMIRSLGNGWYIYKTT